MTFYFNYYYFDKGWEETNKDWYKVEIDNVDDKKHLEMVKWIYNNIDRPDKHARWMKNEKISEFKFRYERNYIIFRLRWQ